LCDKLLTESSGTGLAAKRCSQLRS